MDKHPIDKASDVVGSQAALASLLNVTRAAVGQWKDEGRRVPAEHCLVIERETRLRGTPVTCEELRPDMDWAVLRDQSIEVSSPPFQIDAKATADKASAATGKTPAEAKA